MASLIDFLIDKRNNAPILRSDRFKMRTLAILLSASFLGACGGGADEPAGSSGAGVEQSQGQASASAAGNVGDESANESARTTGDSDLTASDEQLGPPPTSGTDDGETAAEPPTPAPVQAPAPPPAEAPAESPKQTEGPDNSDPVVPEDGGDESAANNGSSGDSFLDDTSNSADPQTSEFKVYNSMVYTGMPAFGTRISLAGEGLFFPNGAVKADGMPTIAGFRNAAASIREQIDGFWYATEELAVIDIERWHLWPWVNGQDHLDSVRLYAESARMFKAETGMPTCHYAVLPSAGLWHSVGATTDSSKRAELEYYTDLVAAQVLPHVDALCPSLYTYYDAPTASGRLAAIEQWKTFAAETIRQARRVAPDKPVYAFLWPHFHNGGSYSDFRELPAEYWRAQLELMLELADGVILWGGANITARTGRLAWRENSPWWQVTQEVLAEHIDVGNAQTP